MRVTNLTVNAARFFAAAGLALAFAFGVGWIDAWAADEDNYFARYTGPASGRTDVDPFDPYAPVDLGPTGGALRLTGPAFHGATAIDATADHCTPMRCRAW